MDVERMRVCVCDSVIMVAGLKEKKRKKKKKTDQRQQFTLVYTIVTHNAYLNYEVHQNVLENNNGPDRSIARNCWLNIKCSYSYYKPFHVKGRCETGPCAGSPALLRKCLVQLSRVFCACGHVVHDLVNEQDETWETWINCSCSRGSYFINACVSYSFCQPLEDFCNCSVISKDLCFDTVTSLFHRGICLRDWSLNGIVLLVCSFPQITTPKPLTCGPLGASLLRCWLEKHSLQVLKHCVFVCLFCHLF